MISQIEPLKLGRSSTFALCLIAGALLPLSLAPLDYWWLAILSPAMFAALLYNDVNQSSFKAFLTSAYSFGLGMFGSGASWVYVSIHDFGYTGAPLAVLLTSLFVAGLALVFTLPFLLMQWVERRNIWLFMVTFASLWVLGEWLRSWLLTGFPWLYVGYSQLTTPLAGWAPIGGVFLLSLTVVFSAASLATLLLKPSIRIRLIIGSAVLCLWLSGWLLQQQQWSTNSGEQQSVTIVQANIPQDKKWLPEYRQPTLHLYKNMTLPHAGANWIVWPEAAIPVTYHNAKAFLLDVEAFAEQSQTSLITGIIYDTPQGTYHNSAIALGKGSGSYHKSRLVPFGEYVPLEHWLRGIIAFFDLPMSAITPGPTQQPPLLMSGYAVGMAICYEIVYPDLVAERAANSEVLVTLSNDAWFGASWGPLQHLQMAQMRALETSRYLIRSTNNGVSAIVAPNGSIQSRSRQFVREHLSGNVTPQTGNTPFTITGSYPTILLCLMMYLGCFKRSRTKHLDRI